MKIIIEEELCTKIERLQYEVNSRKEIITTFLQMDVKSTSKLFEDYQEEYKKYFIEYNKAKKELIEKYEIPKDTKWNLVFTTRELTY